MNTTSRPPYHSDRSEEDWSALCNPALRTDHWDPIKCILLGHKDWYLSVGGEFRPFYEFYRSYNWGLGPQDNNGYLLYRFIGHADFHLSRRARVFFELKSGRVAKEALSYFFQGDLQFGQFGSGQLLAWKYGQSFSYAFTKARLRPVVSLLGAISSGDKNPADPNLQTFHPLFPKGLYYGYLDSSGSLNAIVVHPKVSLPLSKTVSLTADSFFFWRQRVTDGLYSQPGFFLRTGRATPARYVGALQDLEVLWRIDRHTTLQCLAAYYEVGRYLRETPPPGRNTTYLSVKLNYKF